MMPELLPNETPLRFDSLARRIDHLKRERAALEEDIVQLKAAVEVWTEVYRQTRSLATGSRLTYSEIR